VIICGNNYVNVMILRTLFFHAFFDDRSASSNSLSNGNLLLVFQPPYRGFFFFSSGVKRPGHDVDHSPPSSAEVTNEWSYTSVPPICLHGVDRDAFTFLSFFFIVSLNGVSGTPNLFTRCHARVNTVICIFRLSMY
jgi:hypothetical protein